MRIIVMDIDDFIFVMKNGIRAKDNRTNEL